MLLKEGEVRLVNSPKEIPPSTQSNDVSLLEINYPVFDLKVCLKLSF